MEPGNRLYSFSVCSTSTSSIFEKSTDGATSIVWKSPGSLLSARTTVPSMSPFGNIPPRPEVTTASPTLTSSVRWTYFRRESRCPPPWRIPWARLPWTRASMLLL